MKENQANIPKAVSKKPSKINFFWIKTGFFILVCLGCIYGIFRITSEFQSTAEEVKELRAKIVSSQISDQKLTLEAEILRDQEQIELVNSRFPSYSDTLDLLVALDNLQNAGVISESLITSDTAVQDKLGLYGIPLSVTINGDQNTINTAMQALEDLPFIIRSVVFNIKRQEDGSLTATYGGFVYTDEEFNQTR